VNTRADNVTRFAIGTGRPSVVGCERLHQWTEIVKYPGFETFDHLIAAELKLYVHLYEAIYHTVNSVGEVWDMVNRWRRKYLAGKQAHYATRGILLILKVQTQTATQY
jgi:hypothetical protein